MKVVNIITADGEWMYEFESITTDSNIKKFWDEYDSSDYEDFEEFMVFEHKTVYCLRFYVDSEIYI